MYSAFIFTLILIPLAISSNVEEPEKRQIPFGAYAPYPYYYYPYVPQYGANVNQKNFFGLISTSTFTSTSVVTATCTVSTTACTGRRRRGIVIDEDEEIDASAPVKFEASEIVNMDELDREKREPNPQYYYMPTPFGAYPSHYDISPSFDRNVQRPYSYPTPYPSYGVAPQQVLPADQRLFFNVFVGTTITTVSTSTSTSRPACSASSTFTQC